MKLLVGIINPLTTPKCSNLNLRQTQLNVKHIHPGFGFQIPKHYHGVRCFSQQAEATNSKTAGADSFFFADDSVTFASLGLPPDVCQALHQAGYTRPSKSQQLAASPVLQGRDVVLAAETGSGKTIAYLAPLAAALLSSPQVPVYQKPLTSNYQDDGSNEKQRYSRPRHQPAALILCPNVALCEQVVTVASSLINPTTNRPIIHAALISSRTGPPSLEKAADSQLHFVVTTPASLLSFLNNVGPAYGADWTRRGLPLWINHVVYDEADMLLGGSYGRHIKALRELFRIADKEAAEEGVRVELGMSEEEWEMVPWRMQRIAVSEGVAGLHKAGFKVPVNSNESIESILDGLPPLGDSSSIQQQQLPVQKRQYIYVAATMPTEGDHTVGADIAAAHPKAVWLSGHALHQGQGASVTHNWVQLSSASVEERHAAAAEVIRTDALLSQGQGRVLVFTKDIASAEATAAALSSALSIPVLKYHKEVPPLDRSQALDTISTKQGVILVATDAAARGLDLPDISHVIQADFASSAIDFLHRVGRTARAGKSGKVTSLYNEDNAMLVGAIKEAIKEGVPVEGAFSRNRSFKKKVRKYGKYVPRGREA